MTSSMTLTLLYPQRRHAHGPLVSPFPISILICYLLFQGDINLIPLNSLMHKPNQVNQSLPTSQLLSSLLMDFMAQLPFISLHVFQFYNGLTYISSQIPFFLHFCVKLLLLDYPPYLLFCFCLEGVIWVAQINSEVWSLKIRVQGVELFSLELGNIRERKREREEHVNFSINVQTSIVNTIEVELFY